MRVKKHWYNNRPLCRIRLRAFNAQGLRYGWKAIPFEQLESALAKRKGKLIESCCYCGRPLKGELASFDHTIPLSRGGAHALENLAISCKTCNKLKGNWSADLFIKLVGFLNERGVWREFCRQFRRRW